MKALRSTLAVVGALGAAGALSGFKYLDPPRKFRESDMPIEYYVGDAPPAGLEMAETLDLLELAYAAWEQVPCSPLVADYAGAIANEPTFSRSDRTQITHEGSLDTGVNAATVTHANFGSTVSYNGKNFFPISAHNIIFNSGIRWGSPVDVAEPNCFNVNSYLATATHEIGHGIGLGHSCDSGEACPDPILLTATMYWSGARCDGSREDINADDEAGINAIYGVTVDFDVAAADGLTGPAPITVTVSVPEEFRNARYTSFAWNFGDGSDHVTVDNDGAGSSVTHTYETEGEYTISLTATVEDPDCGGTVQTVRRKVGAVLACGEPTPAFEWSNLGDNAVQMRNRTPLSAFGCVNEFAWILDGDEANPVLSYEPRWSFDAPGEHTVTLRADGFGGSAETTQTVQVRRGEGCSAAGQGPWGLGLLALLTLRRRPARR